MPLTLTEAINDTVSITGIQTRILAFPRSLSDTVGITTAFKTGVKLNIVDTVGITDVLHVPQRSADPNPVGIEDSLAVTGVFVQFDSWRPVSRPSDNELILLCRTPLTEHDSYTGLTHLELWTIFADGTHERPEVLSPADNGYGWDSYAHPEWSPSGEDVVVAAETATEYELVVLDATGFGS